MHAQSSWCLDSGAFSEIAQNGRFTTSPSEYARAALLYANQLGKPIWCAPQDWMCEPPMLRATGLTIPEHQRRTVASVLELRSLLAGQLHIIPVLQGWCLEDYLECVDIYTCNGLDLAAEPVVGLGSVCRRQSTKEIEEIVTTLASPPYNLRLHGFGVKTQGLRRYAQHLVSADSMAWSVAARKMPAPWAGCPYKHQCCNNCLHFAIQWRDSLLAQLALDSLASPNARDDTLSLTT